MITTHKHLSDLHENQLLKCYVIKVHKSEMKSVFAWCDSVMSYIK